MTDRADAVAKELSRQLYVEGVPLGTGVAMIADALRAYAEEARREERIIAAKESQMRYEDGYTCGANDERALWVKGEKK